MTGLIEWFLIWLIDWFQDRLVEDEEREWTNHHIDEVVLKHFPNADREKVKGPGTKSIYLLKLSFKSCLLNWSLLSIYILSIINKLAFKLTIFCEYLFI